MFSALFARNLSRVLSARTLPRLSWYSLVPHRYASQSAQGQNAEREGPQVYGQTGKYAQALFNTAKKRGGNTLTTLINDLQRFNAAYSSNQSIQQALDNPVVSAEKKQQMIKKLAPQIKISELSAEFISVIASKGHIGLLSDILADYERLVAYERNEIRAVVTSAEPLTDEQRRKVTDALKKRIGANQSLSVSEKVDPKILGGLVVSIDEKSVDLSVATQIRKIESALRRQ